MNEDLLLEIKNLTVSIQKKNVSPLFKRRSVSDLFRSDADSVSTQRTCDDGNLLPIVKGIDMEIPDGKIVGLVGESGCGKSMTAKSINGILPPAARITGGSILWHDSKDRVTDLSALREKELRKRCGNDIAMIFQEPMTSLNPMMRIGDQIREVLRLHKLEKSPSQSREQIVKMLDSVGIPDPSLRYNSWPHELSGGMRQRVMIAMAMISSPKLLIADEATTALDVTTQAQILKLIKSMCTANRMSALVITHNMGVVSAICDYVYVMYLGTIMEQAPVSELFSNPVHPYTRGLLSSIPKLSNNPEYLKTIPGNIPYVNQQFPGCEFCIRCSEDVQKCFFEKPGLKQVGEDHFVRCHTVF